MDMYEGRNIENIILIQEMLEILSNIIEYIVKMKNDLKNMKEEQRITNEEIEKIWGFIYQLRTSDIVLIFIIVRVVIKVI